MTTTKQQIPFRGYFHPIYNPKTTGLNKEGGDFWIGFIDDDETVEAMIRIELTVWADDSLDEHTYANIHSHYDGIKVLRHLEEIGFLKMFEEIQATTFYDVAQCCARCNILIAYEGDYAREMTPRKIYELLYS